MKMVRVGRRQRGFTLVEIIIAMALAGIVIAGVMFYQSRAENTQKTNDAVQSLVTIVGGIKRVYAAANNYTGLNGAAIGDAGLNIKPFSVSGGNLIDPWGGTTDIVVNSAGTMFALGVVAPSKEACMQLVTSMVDNALALAVRNGAHGLSTAGATPSAFLGTGANLVKTDPSASINTGNALTGCDGATPRVVMVFR